MSKKSEALFWYICLKKSSNQFQGWRLCLAGIEERQNLVVWSLIFFFSSYFIATDVQALHWTSIKRSSTSCSSVPYTCLPSQVAVTAVWMQQGCEMEWRRRTAPIMPRPLGGWRLIVTSSIPGLFVKFQHALPPDTIHPPPYGISSHCGSPGKPKGSVCYFQTRISCWLACVRQNRIWKCSF